MARIIVVTGPLDEVHEAFSTVAGLKRWMEAKGLVFQTWVLDGKKETSKFTLVPKGNPEQGGDDTRHVDYTCEYHRGKHQKKVSA